MKATKYLLKEVEKIQRRAARFVKGVYKREDGIVTQLLNELEWPALETRRKYHRLELLHASLQGIAIHEREIKKSKKIQNSLGPPAEDIIRTKEEEISRREKKIQELQASRETAYKNRREDIDADIEEQRNEISRLEAENDIIEERMSLRDRVKLIFKKYGFTVFAVVSAVGLVIGVIVNNLKKGLTSLGKGVGGALKNIGKKIGEILPGMIGAIASFVFKTAGEVVGFLAKNAWLLILAAVMFMIEKFKRNKA